MLLQPIRAWVQECVRDIGPKNRLQQLRIHIETPRVFNLSFSDRFVLKDHPAYSHLEGASGGSSFIIVVLLLMRREFGARRVGKFTYQTRIISTHSSRLRISLASRGFLLLEL
jgi:hypothetical protein